MQKKKILNVDLVKLFDITSGLASFSLGQIQSKLGTTSVPSPLKNYKETYTYGKYLCLITGCDREFLGTCMRILLDTKVKLLQDSRGAAFVYD